MCLIYIDHNVHGFNVLGLLFIRFPNLLLVNQWVAQVPVKLGEQFKKSSTVLLSVKRPLTQFFFSI